MKSGIDFLRYFSFSSILFLHQIMFLMSVYAWLPTVYSAISRSDFITRNFEQDIDCNEKQQEKHSDWHRYTATLSHRQTQRPSQRHSLKKASHIVGHSQSQSLTNRTLKSNVRFLSPPISWTFESIISWILFGSFLHLLTR